VEHWSAKEWDNNLYLLKQAGITDHIIWQWTLDSQKKLAWYDTHIPGYKKIPGIKDPIGTCLAGAKKSGHKIWIGLNWTNDWWKYFANNLSWLENEFSISRNVSDEIWEIYGKNYGNTIAGFYFTMELDNQHFLHIELQKRMQLVYRKTADHIHSKTKKPVMISPFFTNAGHMKVQEWQAMWENILFAAPIDVINMQDGCGASNDGGNTTHATISTLAPWFEATKCAIQKKRPTTLLWSNVETFDMDEKGRFLPAKDSNRILQQIKAVTPYVSKISSFSFIHYQTKDWQKKVVQNKKK